MYWCRRNPRTRHRRVLGPVSSPRAENQQPGMWCEWATFLFVSPGEVVLSLLLSFSQDLLNRIIHVFLNRQGRLWTEVWKKNTDTEQGLFMLQESRASLTVLKSWMGKWIYSLDPSVLACCMMVDVHVLVCDSVFPNECICLLSFDCTLVCGKPRKSRLPCASIHCV